MMLNIMENKIKKINLLPKIKKFKIFNNWNKLILKLLI
jgi:hypothetical protein